MINDKFLISEVTTSVFGSIPMRNWATDSKKNRKSDLHFDRNFGSWPTWPLTALRC